MQKVWKAILSTCLSGGVRWNFGPIGHLQVQKSVWPTILSSRPGVVIDATCGNGHDSEQLATLLQLDSLSGDFGKDRRLICMDIQVASIEATRNRLAAIVRPENWNSVQFIEGSHEVMPPGILPQSVSLICYNLGYLPGSDRSKNFVVTTKESTSKSLKAAIPLIAKEGLLSVTAYPANLGGREEMDAVENALKDLSPDDWRVYCHKPVNRPLSPHLFLAFRIGKQRKQEN